MGEMSEELLATSRREATVLFGDLRGFTRACPPLTPEGVVDMVNTFMAVAVEAVEHFDGMVDKFVGDEIMAVFGVPLPRPTTPCVPCSPPTGSSRATPRWQKEREAAGLIAPGVGLGIATGEMIVGNIGTSARMDYTVLGHNVNLAARLCGKAGAGEIFTVRETHTAAKAAIAIYHGADPVPHFHFEPRGMVELKNVLQAGEEIIAVTADCSSRPRLTRSFTNVNIINIGNIVHREARTIKRVNMHQARVELTNLVNEVHYGGKRIAIGRRNKELAVLVPIEGRGIAGTAGGPGGFEGGAAQP